MLWISPYRSLNILHAAPAAFLLDAATNTPDVALSNWWQNRMVSHSGCRCSGAYTRPLLSST